MKTFLTVALSVLFLILAAFFWLMGGNMLASVFFILALWPLIRVALFGSKPQINLTVKRDIWS
jgi:hypothetical protein